MRVAVIDHVGNHGGGSRVVRSLLPALRRMHPQLELSYFGNPASIRRENLADELSSHGIRVLELQSLSLANSNSLRSEHVRRAIQLLQSRWLNGFNWLPEALSGNVAGEISRRVRGYDLAFYPWPFLLPLPKLDCPSVGLFHDFNFKYYFGGSFVFSPVQRAQLERQMPEWLEEVTPVVSTHFIASELAVFYPQAAHKTRVVPLAPLGGVELIETARAQEIVRQLGVRAPYLLYPTHLCSHKNVGPLIAAQALLREQGRRIALVLTGAGTETVRGHAHAVGVRLDLRDGDVLGLGYVTNLQMDSLIQCAAAVVNPSLYEAGNGPGLDAWGRGVPVAMSDIPAFREHIDTLGVRAQLFDPRSPQDIAAKVATLLDNPGRSRADALFSLQALRSMTWDRTASGYLNIFRDAIRASGGNSL